MRNSKEEQILCALLKNPTIRSASKASGIPERTIKDYLNRPAFLARYQSAKAEMIKKATQTLQDATEEAARMVFGMMRDEKAPHHVRLNAAKSILKNALKFSEFEDLISRVEQLEDKTS